MNIPFYEIYYANIKNPSLIDLITYKLHKHNKNNRFNKLIYYLDKIKFGSKHKEKFIEDIEVDDLYVNTTTGYQPVSHIYRTKPFEVYKLILENNDTLRCADEHFVYSSCNYIKTWKHVCELTTDDYVLTTTGWSRVKQVINTHDIQFMVDLTVQSNEHNFFSNNILSHNSTTVVAYFVWYMLFHADRNLMITANKESTTKEILKKCMDVFKGLPYFLKPGIEEYSKTTLRTENGCSLRAVATTGDSATGDSINILLIDECALIAPNVIKEFWASVYPTLSSFQQSQIIVLSTPRGRSGLYYELWDGAQKGKNGFVSKRVDWWQVPGRDEAWKQDQISVFGQDLWEREFELSFDTNESRLLGKPELEYFDSIKIKFVHFDIYGVPKKVTDKIYWDPEFKPDELTYEDKIKRRFVCIIDTAEGKEEGEYGKEDPDYNIINIFEMKLLEPDRIIKNRLGYKAVKYTNCIQLVQVGIYIDNNFDEEECAAAGQHIAFDIFSNGGGYQGEIDNMRILYETNFNGKNFYKVFSNHDQFYDTIIKGFRTVTGNHGKKYYCELGAKYIQQRQIIAKQDHDVAVFSTIEQLKAFGKVKNSYAGLAMHDDISITVLFASRFFDDDDQFEWLDEWFTALPTFPYELRSEQEKVQLILQYLDMYQEAVEDDEKESDEMSQINSYASQGFGQITQQTQGTYGSLLNQNNNSSYGMPMPGQRNMYGQQVNASYGPYPLQSQFNQPQYQQSTGTYSSIRNTVTNSRFIRR